MPAFRRLFLSFLKLGLTAFGGPVMVAYIKELSVKRNKWLDEGTFNEGVVLCQSIPGATAMQMAAYVGLRAGGIRGALSAYIGFGLPAFVLMMIFSALYVSSHNLPKVMALFSGLQVMVIAIIASATYSFSREILRNYRHASLAVAAALLFWSGVSPFLVIAGAALTGVFLFKYEICDPGPIRRVESHGPVLKKIAVLSGLVVFGLTALFFYDVRLLKLALLMFKVDIFAFGGGFASLPLMLHEVVDARAWMDSKTFMDGIALGQVTPGPIVITSTFIGYLVYGFWGGVTGTIAIFTPSFLMLVFATPFFDRLKASVFFLRATKGILASFAGLLLFVTVKFSSAVTWDFMRLLLVSAALTALLRKVDILYVVLAGAALSVIIF